MKLADGLLRFRPHWPCALLAAVGLVLIFGNLGSDYLWEDEGDTAALASNILKFGVPKAWDGGAFLDSDHGARLNKNLVMVTHPWVQYYLAAGSFVVFGQNTFAARFPFAIAGWMSIVLAYFFVWRITASRVAAFSAAALLVFSVQFLLYARQCRYCALNLFLTCWLFSIFFRMRSARDCALFVIAAALLFHTHPYGIAPVVALVGLSLIYRPFRSQRRWIWFAAPTIAALTLPWLALSSLSSSGSALNTTAAESIGEFLERCAQAFIETTSVTPFIGAAVLFLICLITFAWQRRGTVRQVKLPSAADQPISIQIDSNPESAAASGPRLFETDELSIILSVFVTVVLFGLATAITQSSDSLWLAGMRYASGVLPLVAIVAGILILKVSRAKTLFWLPLLLLLAFTKLGQLTPWLCWNPSGFIRAGKYSVGAHIPATPIDRFFGTGWLLFACDLWRENDGTVAKTCKFLRKNAHTGDIIIVNYGMEPVYFYTRLPQAMAILRNYPVYETARELKLPDFVFNPDNPHWIVWRSAWETGPGYAMGDVVRDIVARGGQITNVLDMEETVWENREDIHFHRFSDGTYLFPRTQTFPMSHIARVDWPSG